MPKQSTNRRSVNRRGNLSHDSSLRDFTKETSLRLFCESKIVAIQIH
ncbi:hypothetical protein [Helicobacter sp. MIT 01-3238]|nr:hypothetical protein [Helicobacter sp. MIT 01-3238]